MEDPRWWWSASVGVDGLLDRVSEEVGHPVVGIVDEERGGIVAYAASEVAADIVYALNLNESVPGGISLTVACPDCGAEVDVRSADAL